LNDNGLLAEKSYGTKSCNAVSLKMSSNDFVFPARDSVGLGLILDNKEQLKVS
jgi:hypothetical protein